MNNSGALPFEANIDDYQREAEALFDALNSGDEAAKWRFKWEHPRFQGRSVSDVQAAKLGYSDAQLVVAHEYAFSEWNDLMEFAAAVRGDSSVSRFERAVDAVVAGDLENLRSMLRNHPDLTRARSTRRHRATLLHYVAANGVEGARQRTPENAVETAKVLLDAGAQVDALADMYGEKCTTLSLLLSSSHPAEAGLQGALAETLLDHGAALEGPGSKWRSALMTALTFGFLKTARRLAARGARIDCIEAAAGLGLVDETARWLPTADATSRQRALSLAAQLGHADVVAQLLDAGADPDRYNPDGFHSHTTPLHQAVWHGQDEVVRLLVERGARLDLRDTIYQGTPLDWANHSGRKETAAYLANSSLK